MVGPVALPRMSGGARTSLTYSSENAWHFPSLRDEHDSRDEYGRLKTYKPTSGPVAGVNLWYKYNSLGQKNAVNRPAYRRGK